ncbi:SDR family NAD(P)-dependent oxidoreductase [Phyllobacterium chamaecytisi]|uniref:SDR family NAD(P)-dependent oxidoreductase n=1 Tax=Phyllobacterium chamaecytisi TaxID=2876082 RepID=UPI001CCCEF90|nr:SDR family oxidoreductase [Phyllobacterium sp. KW56]MBZ9605326.1 SDR family oxidoreductase [Phyllobacterium sp. KW56]
MFKNKTAIVAGGARDIGRACAVRLAASGAKVAIVYNSSEKAAFDTIDEITASGGLAVAICADLTKQAEVARAVEETQQNFGPRIDILQFVTGGLVARKTVPEMDAEFWHQVLDLNLTSLFLTVKAVLSHMGEGGSIVTFASQAGRDGGGPGALAYATSKGGVMSFTRGLAKEIGPDIRVNALCPGMIDTTFHDNFTKPEVRGRVAGATALKREGTPAEVAEFAAWLSSDAASYVTGGCFDINGGLLFS